MMTNSPKPYQLEGANRDMYRDNICSHPVINLTRLLEGEVTRHYDRFLDEHLSISLVEQYNGDYEDFIFTVSSSQKGHPPYQVRVWRQYHACSFVAGGFGPCSKHGDVVGFCSCQANVQTHYMCKHLAAGYIEARRILSQQGRTIREVDLNYWHPERSSPKDAQDPWELAEPA